MSDGPPSTEPPIARCAEHRHTVNPPPCGACGRARQASEAWDAEQARRAAAAEVEARRQAAAVRAQEIDRCAMCDGEGRLEGGSVCGHDPEQIERNRRAVAALREQLAGATTHRETDPT